MYWYDIQLPLDTTFIISTKDDPNFHMVAPDVKLDVLRESSDWAGLLYDTIRLWLECSRRARGTS